ncbi:DUF397 domain-containing protein [Streptomyces sp. BH097]|uniref:DUF397 domain-containing protein n=1 Tax=unclassified Streptomyces TaxID=2593676 RepID=UPI003BB4F7BA
MNARLTWFKSSYSDSQGGECLEAARTPTRIHVRDSKLGSQGPSFSAEPAAWNRFLDRVRST